MFITKNIYSSLPFYALLHKLTYPDDKTSIIVVDLGYFLHPVWLLPQNYGPKIEEQEKSKQRSQLWLTVDIRVI